MSRHVPFLHHGCCLASWAEILKIPSDNNHIKYKSLIILLCLAMNLQSYKTLT